MCVTIVKLFQEASTRVKWLLYLFLITGLYTVLYWFFLIPVLFESLKSNKSSETWVQHWKVLYFAFAFLLWGINMIIIVGLWYLCRNRTLRNVEDPVTDALVDGRKENSKETEVKDRVRQSLALNDLNNISEVNEKRKSHPNKKEANGDTKRISLNVDDANKAKKVDDLKLEGNEIIPLPEYSPEAKSSIFDFSEEATKEERKSERSRSPFREFLHLVQVESPGSPERTFEEECLACLEKEGHSNQEEKPNDSLDEEETNNNNIDDNVETFSKHRCTLDDLRCSPTKDSPPNEVEDVEDETTKSDTIDDEVKIFPEQGPALEDLRCSPTKDSLPNEVVDVEDQTTKSDTSDDEVEIFPEQGHALDDLRCSPTKESEEVKDQTTKSDTLEETHPENSPKLLDAAETEFPVKSKLTSDQAQEANVNITELIKKKKPSLVRKESAMFLGNIGRSGSVVSELIIEVDHGKVVAETAVIMGRSHVLTTPQTP